MKPITARHRAIVVGITTALLISGALAGCSARGAAAAPADLAEPIAVRVVRVAMSDVASASDAGGVVQARTTAAISARILAPVREVRVSPGDRVRKGQTLIVLDGDDLSAASRAARSATLAAEQGSNAAAAELRAADAALTLARASHDRIAGLQARRSATAQELDEATATLRSAEARVAAASARALQTAATVETARATRDQASATESFTRVTAPFDGMVTEKIVEPGNMAAPGTPLLHLEDTRAFRLEVRVDESRVGQIHNGDGVPVFLGGGTTSITGTVVEISRAVDADARAFLVKIALPDAPGRRSGEFGKARFRGTPRRALTIPPSAIVRHGQLSAVFVIDKDVARVRLVNLSESEVRRPDGIGAGDSFAAARRHRRTPRQRGGPVMASTYGMAGRMAATFIQSKLTPLFILTSMALGGLAVVALPREEEPQIIVPMVDVFAGMPGATPADVEQRVTRPMEQLLWAVPGRGGRCTLDLESRAVDGRRPLQSGCSCWNQRSFVSIRNWPQTQIAFHSASSGPS